MAQLILALENIRSAWNVGAIMRTCDALGAELILTGYTARPEGKIKERIKKTSIGAEETVAWKYFEHPTQVFEEYKQSLHISLEISDDSLDIYQYLEHNRLDIKKYSEVVIWLGNEIHGVSDKVRSHSQSIVHLPMNGSKESLNVATTAGIAGYLFYPNIKNQ